MIRASSHRYSRLLFERGLALIYLVAFLVAANQFVPLTGEHGLLPAPTFIRHVPFRYAPSLFYLAPFDWAFRCAAWAGVALALVAFFGLAARRGALLAAAPWALLWLLYLSFVNVGQTFYGFGWETLLLETGFLAIFVGSRRTEPSIVLIWLLRWLLFRLMFGAGLIKVRGDPCWRDLSCLDYYFETQPIPNPLSWYFHWLPAPVHHAGVALNHFAELVVPFGFFAPAPVSAVAGLVTIAFQLMLIVSGNLSWLNWLAIVIAVGTVDDRWLRWLQWRRSPTPVPSLQPAGNARRITMGVLAVAVGLLSIPPVLNMLSSGQAMNASFEPIHLVNTYGAFGSVTRTRNEIVLEGTLDATLSDATVWREYTFKGKPGDPARLPAQIAPYHLRLDWLMWFAAMSEPREYDWFAPLLTALLRGDPAVLSLLQRNPFPDRPPRYVRALYYSYRFTTSDERRRTGRWWDRRLIGIYYPAVSLPEAGVSSSDSSR
jgi:hypothetical protein